MANQRFWCMETKDEFEVVKRLLRRRFGLLVDELSEAFDEIDPLDIVYPGNSDEYGRVVREFVVLMQGRDHRSVDDLRNALKLSLAACFNDPVELATENLLLEKVASLRLEALTYG